MACELLERIWARTNFMDSCWVWTGATNDKGYGQICVPNRRIYVHRVVCAAFHGDPPFPKAEAMHACDNPPCVRPDHLQWATHQENIQDAGLKNRMGSHNNLLKTHCLFGHVLSAPKTVFVRGRERHWRRCLECHAKRSRERMRRQRAKTDVRM